MVDKILFRRGLLTAKLTKSTKRRAVQKADGRCQWADVSVERAVFEGGKWGSHSIEADDMARVRAHWDGYCEANGVRGNDMAVGSSISFRRGMFDRVGRVLALTPKRVRVVYYNKGNKARVECWIPVSSVTGVRYEGLELV